MKVSEIMTGKVATASPDTTLEAIAVMMKDEDTGAIPVVEDDELIGLVTDRDIVLRGIAEGLDVTATTVDTILSDELETVEPEADVSEASRLMSRKQIRRLPVVENGRLVGIVSLGDIAVKAGEQDAAGALEDVSRGVKTRKPQAREGGSRRAKQAGGRQHNVIPIRNQGKKSSKRRAS